jgi:hypothetical protein
MAYELTEEKLAELTRIALQDEEFAPFVKIHELEDEQIIIEVSRKLLPEISSITEHLERFNYTDLSRLKYLETQLEETQERGRNNYDIERQIEHLKIDIESVTDVINKSIIQAYIEPIIREIINRFELGNSEKNLVSKIARGLSEVPYSDYETPTKAKATLTRLFESMNGGSIGIAGPRGVGKSTLIRSFCSSNLDLPLPEEEKPKDRKLAILISVPVKYDARDFILQIFSSVCREVLKYAEYPVDVMDIQPFRQASPKSFFQKFLDYLSNIQIFLIIALVCGVVGIFTSTFWTRSLLYTEAIAALPTPTATMMVTRLPPTVTPTIVVTSSGQVVVTSVGPAAVTAQPTVTSKNISPSPSFSDILVSLGIEPKPLFNFSVLLILISGILIYVSEVNSRSRRSLLSSQYSYLSQEQRLREDKKRAIDDLRKMQEMIQEISLSTSQKSIENWEEENHEIASRQMLEKKAYLLQKINEIDMATEQAIYFQKRIENKIRDDDYYERKLKYQINSRNQSSYFSGIICRLAEKHLQNIRFQQSFSSGSSGSIKLPIGLEASTEYASSLMRNQMSLPEIVEEFKGFVNKLTQSENCKVVIGIDELDKITSIETARAFINEAKAIFGISNCFYLMSVSENAMSNFERRGLPIRDEFDSAFDHVLYLDYLDYKTARTLLGRRVIGMPDKFMDLAYVMSGGLPRDLIRYCRLIFDYAQTLPDEVPFIAACKKIVSDDIRSKIRATNISIGEMEIPSTSYDLLSEINQLELNVNHSDEVIEILDRMKQVIVKRNAGYRTLSDNGGSDLLKEEYIKIRAFHVVVEELISYVYFSMTVFAFFTNRLWRSYTNYFTFIENSDGSDLFRLARCRQAFSINPQHAYGLITQFRKEYEWTIIEEPEVADINKDKISASKNDKQSKNNSSKK